MMQRFACWAIAKRSLRWQCTALCNLPECAELLKKDTPKVSTKWLGRVWKSSRTDWELRCWIDYVAG
jgi:hypothetical protein